MEHPPEIGSRSEDIALDGVERLSTVEILTAIASRATVLMNKELALARSELKQQIAAEVGALKSGAAAALAALIGVNLLFVAGVFALAPYVEPWIGSLCLAGLMLLLAVALALVARSKQVTRPLEVTRRTLEENVQWAEEKLA